MKKAAEGLNYITFSREIPTIKSTSVLSVFPTDSSCHFLHTNQEDTALMPDFF